MKRLAAVDDKIKILLNSRVCFSEIIKFATIAIENPESNELIKIS